MKQAQPETLARKFEKTTNIFYLMVGMPLLIFAWTYLNLNILKPFPVFENPVIGPLLHFIIFLGVVFLLTKAFKNYKQKMAQPDFTDSTASMEQQVMEKAHLFINASLPFYWFLTYATILVLIGFYFSVEELYIGAYSVILIIFSIKRPTADRMIKEMRLKKEEKVILFDALKNPDA